MIPRSYQQATIDGAIDLWRRGHRRIAAVLATGAGKTVVFSHIAKLALATGAPTLILAHRAELLDQALDKLQQVNPEAKLGRIDARLKQYRAQIVVASVAACATPTTLALLRTRRWGLIVIDETHHATAATYMRVLTELGAFEPDGPLTLGVTATLDRADGRALGEVFEAVIEPPVGLLDLIKHPDGPFLVPPRGIRVQIAGLDLGRVRRVAGDFNSGALGAAMSAAMAPQRIVEAWQEHAKGRPTVAFLPTVEISIEQAEAFRQAGYRARHLDGTTPAGDRSAALDAFRAGDIDVLTNVALFTEGTDLPSISCVILGRPTSSTSLYQQQVGRGLRLHPGKTDCIILDVSGVTGRHRLATLSSLDGAAGPEDMPDDLLLYEDDEQPEDTPEADDGAEPAERPEYADGDTVHALVDLFGQSHSAWLRTPGGTWFLTTPHGFVHLAPRAEPERYDLAYRSSNGTAGVIREDLTIEYAMAAGDEYVSSVPMWQLDKQAPWRKDPRKVARFEAQALARATAALDRS